MYKCLLDSGNPFLGSERKCTAGGSQPKLSPRNPKLHIYAFCVKSFLLCHTTDYWFWSKWLCLSCSFLDEITVRFYSYHFRICLCYSKKLSQVYTKQEEFCFWRAPQLGFYMLEIIAVLPHCLFPTLGI